MKVSWDDDIPNWMENMFHTTKQWWYGLKWDQIGLFISLNCWVDMVYPTSAIKIGSSPSQK